ncbi:unnamed protein product [Prorocentrum cordatum]|uniref:Uncharacterized protein n=1 Tax=Prorocentrum cordatum TaxID=2364126 RepID=A0ABN9XDU6_9DINO|nr:unnamed protein product [Polarella glacialis]
MQLTMAAALLLLGAFAPVSTASAVAGAQQVTPVQKVITLMEGMMEQGKKEKEAEQVQFAAYKQFCEDTTSLKQKAIAEANDKIDVLKADIEKYLSDAEQLKKEIEGHDADISAWDGDMKAATKVRGLEKADYETLHTDYSESVSALQRAIEVLKKQAYNRPQAAFVQLADLNGLSLIPPEAKRAIAAFLQQDPDAAAEGLEVSAPEAYGYEFQSKGVIEMLEKLLDKFIAERTTLEKTEVKTQQEFEMLMQDLESSTAQAKQDREEKAELKAKALQAKADAEGDLTDTTTTRDADQQYLTDLVATCEQKATDFESRQTLRAEELVAIKKAIEIISSDAVSANAEKHLAATDAEKAAYGSAFAALRSATGSESQEQAAQYLRQQADRIGSRVLSTLAGRVETDPFKKVLRRTQDLITRLMEEANEEAEHKGWCDTELSTNEQTRKTKTQAVETLHAEIDQLQTSTAKLSEEIAEHTKAVAELQKAMAEATELRKTEKEKNEDRGSHEAQTAVAQALVVLKEFYAKAAEATALLQQQPPPIFEKAYTGMGGEAGGVVGMLEVIESDFARLEAETKASEASAQKEYDMFMTDQTARRRALRPPDIEHKTAKRQDEEQALTVSQADLEGTQKDWDMGYVTSPRRGPWPADFDKLKPSCVDAGVSRGPGGLA